MILPPRLHSRVAGASLGLVCFTAIMTLAGCATVEQAPSVAEPADFTNWQRVQTWDIEASPRAFALAPDGSYALFSFIGQPTGDGVARYDAETGAITRFVPELPRPVSGEAKVLSIAPDGASFAASWPGAILAMSTADGSLQRTILHRDGGQLLYFNDMDHTPDGTQLVGVTGTVDRVDLVDGKFMDQRALAPGGSQKMDVIDASTTLVALRETTQVVTAGTSDSRCTFEVGFPGDVAASPDGSRVVAARREPAGFRVWRAADCTVISDWDVEGFVPTIDWLPDGRHFAASSPNGAVNFWDSDTGTLAYALQAHSGGVTMVEVAPDGQTLLSLSPWEDKQISLWRAGSL